MPLYNIEKNTPSSFHIENKRYAEHISKWTWQRMMHFMQVHLWIYGVARLGRHKIREGLPHGLSPVNKLLDIDVHQLIAFLGHLPARGLLRRLPRSAGRQQRLPHHHLLHVRTQGKIDRETGMMGFIQLVIERFPCLAAMLTRAIFSKVVEGQRLSEMTAAFLVAFILIGCSLGSVISTPLVRLL